MATTAEWYQRSVRDYEDKIRDGEAEIAFLRPTIADAEKSITALRAQARAAPSGSEEQAVALEKLNNLTSRRNELEGRLGLAEQDLSRAQGSLNQAQADLARVSQGEPAPAPPTPAAAAADPEVRATEARVVATNNQVVDNFQANPQTDPGEVPGVTVFGSSLATDPGVTTAPAPVAEPIQDNFAGGATPDDVAIFGATADDIAPVTETFAGNGYGFTYDDNSELVPFEEDDQVEATADDTEDQFAGDGYGFEYNEDGELIPADDPFTPDAFSPAGVSPDSDPAIPTGRFDTATADDIAPVPENTSPIPPLSDLSYEDNGDGTGFTVYDSDGQVVQVFDTEQDAEAYIFQQQNASSGFGTYPTTDPFGFDEASLPPAAVTQQSQAQIQAAAQQARAQKAMAVQRAEASQGDWRVRLRLAGASDYLYKAADPGILQPLAVTDGVIFPYTPQITTGYSANYSTYDLTHSNYRGVFYQNSTVDELQIQATFTAQDTFEANYLLAVIHFFRSVTKMFYGQDPNRGVPPPLVFLQGLGEFQYNLHPCVVKTFNYTTPNDVDYIRARTSTFDGTSLLRQRDRQTNSAGSGVLGILDLVAQRRNNAGLPPGGQTITPAPPTLGTASPTYVPTKLDISLALLPVQTRRQVSQEFSLEKFANGTLIKGGFW